MPTPASAFCFGLLIGLFHLAFPGTLHAAAADAQTARRPNVVFILADDLGISDLSCYGRSDQPTPHLDKLAAQGMRFTSAYAAASVCSPTRAALLTGKAPARLHLTTFLPGRPDAPSQLLLHPKIAQQLPLGEQTIAAVLKAAGYATACIGKWHLGGTGFLPTDHGFDLYFAGKAQTEPSATEGGKGEYDLTAQAEKFMEENQRVPFFLYLAHNNPHVPLVAKKELIAKHQDAFNPVYAAMIETLDDCVGRLIAKLDALGLADNTLVVFTSDNGGLHVLELALTPATWNRPFRAGKGFCYEGGLRVPLIVRWPGKVKEQRVTDVPVITTDWMPTLLELVGLPPVPKLDGVSFAGLLSGGPAPPARPLYWHQPHYTNQGGRPAGAIRVGDWKLIEQLEDGACELYNLAKDSGEATDLATKEPGRVAQMRGLLEKWRREVGAQENTANPAFNGNLWKQLYADVDASKLMPGQHATEMVPSWTSWRAVMDGVLPKKSQSIPGAGAVLLHARAARVHGSKLRFEPAPEKDTLGFWTQRDDWADWPVTLGKAGLFEIQVLQGCGKGSGGAEVVFSINGQDLGMKVEETGHFQRFVPRSIGTVRFDSPGLYELSVRAKTKPGPAVMDLRRIVLRAAAVP